MHRRHKHIIIGFGTIIAGGIITTGIILFGYGSSLQASNEAEVPIITEPPEIISAPQEADEVPLPLNIGLTVSAEEIKGEVAADSDSDGLFDAVERQLGTDVNNPDTDGDGYKDGEEIENGYSPLHQKPDRSLITRVLEVNLDRQEIYYIAKGVKVKTFPVSTGIAPQWRTPTGQFRIMSKIPVARYIGPGYDLPNVKWSLEFKNRYFIHGAYWHNRFGQPMSHGCINLSEADAEKVYKFLQTGDSVSIYGKTPV